jgi:hypothetical protein
MVCTPETDSQAICSLFSHQERKPIMAKELTLSASESKQLEADKTTVRKGMATFVEVGKALMRIRDAKLYRVTHKTFAAFCEEEFQLAKSRAYQLIEAAGAAENVHHGGQTQVENVSHGTQIPPANERQARVLSSVPAEQQPEVWEQVVASAPINAAGTPVITARHVQSVVDEFTEETGALPGNVPQASIVLDALKRPIPKHLTEKHATAVLIQSAATKLDAVKHALEAIREVEGVEFLQFSPVFEALKDLKRKISDARYWSECPRCQGKVKAKCDRCDGEGYLPFSRKGQLSAEDKTYLGVEK